MRWMCLLSLAFACVANAQLSPARIPQDPDIFGDWVTFATEGDVWLGNLTSGITQRLTKWPGAERKPRFSPDGTQIAFIGSYDGRQEVYVVPVSGGQPERVTWDPGGAELADWTPDGRGILYASRAFHDMGDARLVTARIDSGNPVPLPMPMAFQGAYNGDGSMVAFTRIDLEGHIWKRYRGGMANDIYGYNTQSGQVRRLSSDEINEQFPVWLGQRLFLVSEKNGSANLYELNLSNLSQRQVTFHSGPDVKSPGSDGKRIIYRQGQDLFVWSPAQKEPTRVKLGLSSDRIHAVPFFVTGRMEDWSVGPTGKRLLVESRGQVFNAPTEAGDFRPVAATPGERNKLARWSPNGQWIAWVSDRDDEENLWVSPVSGGTPRKLTQVRGVAINSVQWSPNSKFLLVWDASSTLWRVDLESGQSKRIDQDEFGAPISASISPSGRFIAYVKGESFNTSSIYVWDETVQATTRLTQAPTRDWNPVFDRTSRYLYFLSLRNVQLEWDTFDFQLNSQPAGRIVFVPLTQEARNPLADVIDEERVEGQTQESTAPDPRNTFDLGLATDRFQFIPGVVGDLGNLVAGSQRIWWLEGGELKTYDFASKQVRTLAQNVSRFELVAEGNRIAAEINGRIKVGEATQPLEGNPVSLEGWRVRVEPLAEWKQILRESWRRIRDDFYDPNLHGANWPAVWDEVASQLPAVADRADLNDLIGQMQASVNVSHMFGGGGTNRFTSPGNAGGQGFLGADLVWDGTGMQFKRIFSGDGFEESARSPLTNIGIPTREGHYLIAINGEPVSQSSNVAKMLDGQGGKLIQLTTHTSPRAEGASTFWIRAMNSDRDARYMAWVGENRRRVQEMGARRLGYVHVPDMGEFGMQEFTKHFYANLRKEGIVIDVRYNGGGITSGMVLERLRRVIFEYDQGRYGEPYPYHRMGFIPKVIILTNEMTASDGEYFSFGFRHMKLGSSVGVRTWGGYAAVGGFSTLDGGMVSVPVQGSFDPDGKWLPDGYGFKPDHEVMITTEAFAAGRDPQVERAVQLLLDQIRKDPVRHPGRQKPPVKLP